MYYCYRLHIWTSKDEQIDQIDQILGVKYNYPKRDWWLEIVQGEDDPPFDFINYFLSILEGKYKELEKINIFPDDIAIWMLYEYDEQCNMEFSPDKMKKIRRKRNYIMYFLLGC